jgi:2-polyprenyl-3-methyl-5-hydroxy-6-metoxy-1,4-benzoquinol methylase
MRYRIHDKASLIKTHRIIFMEKLDFVDQSHWNKGYESIAPTASDEDDPIRMLLESTLPKGRLRSFEMGCYPGRYLAVLGGMGHELNGCDLTPRVRDLAGWFRQCGFETGSFKQQDVFQLDESSQYDVVASFGLIEHFGNWESLIIKHANLVAPGGYLVVTTPNFRSPLQYFLHKTLDSENLKIHNVDSMDPAKWAALAKEAGLEVLFHGGIGRFEFWAAWQKRNILQKIVLRLVRATRPLWQYAPEGTLALAPYYGVIARRPAD